MADDFEPAAFARDFQQFVANLNRLTERGPAPLPALLREHLGHDPAGLPAVSERLQPAEHPNLQAALDEIVGEGGWRVVGLPLGLRTFAGFSLATLATDRLGDYGLASPQPGPVEHLNVAVGPDETRPCVQLALYLGRWRDIFEFEHPMAVLVALGDEQRHQSGLTVEVLAPSREISLDFLDHLRARREALNVYRGRTLTFRVSQYGQFSLHFLTVEPLERSQVILPETDLRAIEDHTVGITAQAAVLRATGRHIKRGLLLHGPPGTGKTLSVTYLRNRMPDRTTVVINGGPDIHSLGQATALARKLQPSMVVLEDVDLIAHDRMRPGSDTNPLLFQLLNEMDGLDPDADVIFVLTTNRLDLLEPALAMRPGRIDQAVEIKLPDDDCRRRLFELYLRDVPHADVDLDALVTGTDGVSAAFIRELVRRAVLLAADDEHDPAEDGSTTVDGDGEVPEPVSVGDGGIDTVDGRPEAGGEVTVPTVEGRHLTEALAALEGSRAPVLRTLLGAARQG